MSNALNILFLFLQVVIGGIGIYQLLLGFAGLRKRKETRVHPIQKSFAILVAAHNEEKVLAALLENLQKLDYPDSLYDTYVICDNCSDRTADIARAFSVRAMERVDLTKRGKGHAIEWMLEQLWKQKRNYDGVIILDADNLISSDFLLEMNEKLSSGSLVVQAYLETKNPYDSWVTLSYALMYWYMNRLWQLARHNLQLPVVLGGTGICIETGLLKEMGWGANSLTEDVEFTARCVERGVYPTWADKAIVYDEKPLTLWSSMRQRLRWMQGHFYCARHYFLRLITLSIRNRNLSQLDAALYLFQPFRFILYIMYIFILYFQVFTSTMDHWGIWGILPRWFWILTSVLLYLQTPLVLFIERKPWKAYVGYIPYYLFLFTWIPVTIWAFFSSNNQKWSHTKHTRAIKIEQISR